MAHLTTTAHPYAFFEGKVVPVAEANVSIMTNALQYGTGIFSGIRGYYNAEGDFISIFRLEDHIKRFLQSFRIIGVKLEYDHKQLCEITIDLMKRNAPRTDTYIRPFGYAGSLNLSPNLERDSTFAFAEYMIPLGEYIPVDKGISVMVSSWRRVTDNTIPSRAKITGAYMNSALAKQEANRNGHEEAIFLNEAGSVVEGSAMNIFLVRDGVLITPAKYDDILEGITRRSIITLANDMGIPVEERTVDRSELYVADEAFFSGTGAQVSWISAIDHRPVGDGTRGPITTKLQEMFFRVARGQEKKYAKWCTKVAIASK
ncbi:MAG: branched-chain amino acid transaminase [Patescibacteria group bacterium]|nr:branched-chain amino acid transaminase [Patescibacteria group bacterium]